MVRYHKGLEASCFWDLWTTDFIGKNWIFSICMPVHDK